MNPLLGVAMGAGANQYLKLEDNARANRKDERDTALNERQVKTADMQLEQGRMAIDKLRQKEDLGRLYRSAATGDPDALNQVMGRYNSNTGVFGDGLKVVPQGDRYDFADAKGNVVRSIPNDPQSLRPVLQQAYLNELSYLDDNAMYKGMDNEARNRQLGIMDRNAATQEKWRADQAENQAALLALHQKEFDARLKGGQFQNHAGGLNPLQAYTLQQAKNFDAERANIIGALQSGQLDENAARQRLNLLSLKYGGQMREPKAAPEIDPKAKEAYYRWIGENPQATDDQANAFKRRLGIPAEPSATDRLLQSELAAKQQPAQAPTTPYRVGAKSGLGYDIVDPRLGRMDAIEWARRTGNDWVDVPLGNR